MGPNPITDDIRAIRHRLAAERGNDVYRIGAELRRREQEYGRTVVRLPKRDPSINTMNQVLHWSSGGESALQNQSTPGTQ